MPEHPTPELLRHMLIVNDEKHDANHDRLRYDLELQEREMKEALERLAKAQHVDHELLIALGLDKVARKEMTTLQAVLLSAAIAGACTIAGAVIQAFGR